jgi:large subunit ribosomal protein L2
MSKKIEVILTQKLKHLTTRLTTISGRSKGTIVVRHRGGFNKRIYRFIDYKRILPINCSALLVRISYSPKPKNHVSLICYSLGIFSSIISPNKIEIGAIIQNYTNNPINLGDSGPLRNIASGSLIHNISLRPFGTGVITRASGCSSVLVRTDKNASLVKLKSGELRLFNVSNTATIGAIGDDTHFLKELRKAGSARHLGLRPRVRAYAMNPVDHPMGGRTKGGTQPLSPQGRLFKHRSTKKYFHKSILQTKRSIKFKS